MGNKESIAACMIGPRLRECREAKGWTLSTAAKRLSEASGVTVIQHRWSMWERGNPPQEWSPHLASLFGTAPDYFSAWPKTPSGLSANDL